MVTIATSTRPESREDALIRLADQARTSGVKFYQDRADGRFYASSRSRSGTYHRLTAWTCTCRGFAHHQRCTHLAALHAALGWVEREDPDPTPPAALASTRCPDCQDSGQVTGTISTGRSWTCASVTCPTCHGCGERGKAA